MCSKLICDLKLPLNKKDGSHLLYFGRYSWCETCFAFASSESHLLPPSLGSYFLFWLLKQLFNISNPTVFDHCAPVGLKIYRCCSNRHLWQSFTRIFRSSLCPGHGSHPWRIFWQSLDKENLLKPFSASTRESENCWPGLCLPWIICYNSRYS